MKVYNLGGDRSFEADFSCPLSQKGQVSNNFFWLSNYMVQLSKNI